MIERALPRRRLNVRATPVLLLGALLGAAGVAAQETTSAGEQRAAELATCAAYYLNATNARPLRDYEALYSKGERALNRARRILAAAQVDRLVGDASAAMTAMTGGDWRRFDRVSEIYAADCDELLGRPE